MANLVKQISIKNANGTTAIRDIGVDAANITGTVETASEATHAASSDTANTLGSKTLGSATKPIYLKDGVATECNDFSLTAATTSKLGGVKIGNNINVTSDGTISVNNLAAATTSTLGGIKVGSNLSITADGTLSAEDSTEVTDTYKTATASANSKVAASAYALQSLYSEVTDTSSTSSLSGLQTQITNITNGTTDMSYSNSTWTDVTTVKTALDKLILQVTALKTKLDSIDIQW